MAIHSISHRTDTSTPKSTWEKEIIKARSYISKYCSITLRFANSLAGIPEEEIVGFRAPDLKYNNDMAAVLKERGFLYDSSIPIDTTSKAFYHPYTMDYGAIEQSWKAPYITTPHPGLWEFPLPTLVNDDFTTITIQDPEGSPEEIIELLEKNFGKQSI